jgi:hypothetical protein
MQYVCENNHHFMHPAKQVLSIDDRRTILMGNLGVQGDYTETSVCPFCLSKTFTEEKEADVANVLVVELTTGPQIAIDKALSEGYKVVGRYAKQYILEKPKAKPVEQPDSDCNQAITEAAETSLTETHP